MEAAGLATFMISASVFTILLYHPASPMVTVWPEFLRRVIVGVAMGLTAVAIVYSPWGQQSGAHLNPAVTLTFFRLGKVAPWDAVFYVLAQFAGGGCRRRGRGGCRRKAPRPSVDQLRCYHSGRWRRRCGVRG